jgi:hypothetical protein
MPSTAYAAAAANAGLISLSWEAETGDVWQPAVGANTETPGSQAQPNYLGSWSSFAAANSSASLSQLVGSSGVDLANNTAWAVIDGPGQYAVGVQVFTEQTFTINVT